MTAERTEVAVIGGGVIGLAVAFELAGRGRRVTLLERGEPGAEASAVAAGMLAPTSESEGNAVTLLNLQLDSLGRYREFTEAVSELSGLDCGYRSEGALWAARHRDDELELEHLAALQRDRGLTSRMVGAREVRELEPYVTPRAVGGLLVEDDHQVDPRRLLPALALAVERRGVELRRQTRVSGVFPEAGGVRIAYGESDELVADVAVIAAGVWSEDRLETPAPPLGLRPVKGQLLRLRGEPLIEHVVRTPDVYLVPRRDGELIVGASEEEQGFDAQPTAGAVFELLRDAWEVLPGIYDLHLDEISVGFRPAVRDHLPVIGPADGTGANGVFVATGHYRNGILLAPATAWWLAEAIEGGGTPPLLADLQASRLAGGS